MRKVCGAFRTQLVKQFLFESTLVALVALVIAVALVELVLPAFNGFTGKALSLDLFGNGVLLWALLGTALLVGLASGSYPAFVLSAFQPASVLKGDHISGARGTIARRLLVISQFTVSIILFAGTAVVLIAVLTLRSISSNLPKLAVWAFSTWSAF